MSFLFRPFLLVFYLLCGWPAEGYFDNLKSGSKHPLHLSAVTIEHQPRTGTLGITCRIFTDDFETILSRNYSIKADLIKPSRHSEMEGAVRKYLASHLQLSLLAQPLKIHYIGFENDQEAVSIYLETEPVGNLKNLEITSNILYDLFDDQVNIFHLSCQGKRKSAKLDYPAYKLILTL